MCGNEKTCIAGYGGGYCLKMLTVVAVEGVQCLLAVSADLRDTQCK